jgi:hypothetical protein
MTVDAIEVMYWAFQAGRTSGDRAADELRAVLPVIARVRERGTTSIDDDDPCLALVPEYARTPGTPESVTPPPSVLLDAANQIVFAVIEAAAHDLVRLCEAGESVIVRNLGYAVHNLPALLRRPAELDRQDYMFCLRFIAYGWAHESDAFKVALARLLDVTPARLDEYVTQEGFARSQYEDTRRT